MSVSDHEWEALKVERDEAIELLWRIVANADPLGGTGESIVDGALIAEAVKFISSACATDVKP